MDEDDESGEDMEEVDDEGELPSAMILSELEFLCKVSLLSLLSPSLASVCIDPGSLDDGRAESCSSIEDSPSSFPSSIASLSDFLLTHRG